MEEMNMKNENYLDAEAAVHLKQEMVKRLHLQLKETHNMLYKPQKNGINKQKPYNNQRQRVNTMFKRAESSLLMTMRITNSSWKVFWIYTVINLFRQATGAKP